jgi:hypothetical protein
MARVLSQSNRERYRKLASGDAFKRETRCGLSSAADNGRASISRDPRRID